MHAFKGEKGEYLSYFFLGLFFCALIDCTKKDPAFDANEEPSFEPRSNS